MACMVFPGLNDILCDFSLIFSCLLILSFFIASILQIILICVKLRARDVMEDQLDFVTVRDLIL